MFVKNRMCKVRGFSFIFQRLKNVQKIYILPNIRFQVTEI